METHSIERLTKSILRFRDERNWGQFHNAKDLALALSIEAGELNEQFLWKSAEEANLDKVAEELADVFIYGFLLAHRTGLDVEEIIGRKLERNAEKYPVDKSFGSARKYTDL
jgi:NTP pyrophosphatase (non-canonical NTP hydrolase)